MTTSLGAQLVGNAGVHPRPAARSGSFVLGVTLPVHRLGFGAMRITGKGSGASRATSVKRSPCCAAPVELGVNLIDTADSYGPEVSERFIAEALYPYPQGLVIATKAGLERPGPTSGSRTGAGAPPRGVRRQPASAQARAHRPLPVASHRSRRAVRGPTWHVQAAAEEGKIRHVGLSEVSVAEIERARKIVPIVSVQNRYSPTTASTSAWSTTASARKWPSCRGTRSAPGGAASGKPVGEGGRTAPGHARAGGARLAATALSRDAPDPGDSSVKHLEENVAAALLELSTRDLEDIARAS